MKRQKTQQFSKFFLKDLKTINPNYSNDKYELDESRISSSR